MKILPRSWHKKAGKSYVNDLNENVTTQLAQTEDELIGNQKETFNSFNISPPKETLFFFDSAEVGEYYKERLSIIYKDRTFLRLKKTGSTSPGIVQFTPEMIKKPNNNNRLAFELQCSDWSKVTNLLLNFYPDGDKENYFRRNLRFDKNAPTEKPLLFAQNLGKQGAPLDTGITNNALVELEITAQDGVEFSFHGAFYQMKKSPLVAIQFDDGRQSVYDMAYPIMRKHNIPGTFNVITSRMSDLEATNFCDWKELYELQSSGWTIGNHTRTSVNVNTTPMIEAIADVENGRNDLIMRGFTGGDIFAPPFNALDSTTKPYLKHLAKSFKYGVEYTTTYDKVYDEGFLNQSKSVQASDEPNDLIDVFRNIDDDIAFTSYCFHDLTTLQSPSQFSYNIDKFEAFIDGLIEEGAVFINLEQLADAFIG